MSKPDVRFAVEIKTMLDYSTFVTFKASAVYLVEPDTSRGDDSGVRNPLVSDRWGPTNLAHLADFVITAQREVGNDRWYGFNVGYAEPYRVDLRQAEAMVKFLRKVERHLDKRTETEGSPIDLAAYCARVAQAASCTTPRMFGFYSRELNMNGTNWGWRDTDSLRSILANADDLKQLA